MMQWHDRRKVPLIKRLSAAAVVLLILGLIADNHISTKNAERLGKTNERLVKQLIKNEKEDRETINAMKTIIEALDQQIRQLGAQPRFTLEDIDAIIKADLGTGRSGSQGPAGPTGPQGPTGPTPTTTSTTTTTTRPALVCVRRTCIAKARVRGPR